MNWSDIHATAHIVIGVSAFLIGAILLRTRRRLDRNDRLGRDVFMAFALMAIACGASRIVAALSGCAADGLQAAADGLAALAWMFLALYLLRLKVMLIRSDSA